MRIHVLLGSIMEQVTDDSNFPHESFVLWSFFFLLHSNVNHLPSSCVHTPVSTCPSLLCFLPLWLPDHFHLCVVPLHVYIFRPRPFLLSLACGLVRPRKLVFIEPLFWQSLTLSFAFVCDDAALWSMTYDLTVCDFCWALSKAASSLISACENISWSRFKSYMCRKTIIFLALLWKMSYNLARSLKTLVCWKYLLFCFFSRHDHAGI